jgi:hypothetical protein
MFFMPYNLQHLTFDQTLSRPTAEHTGIWLIMANLPFSPSHTIIIPSYRVAKHANAEARSLSFIDLYELCLGNSFGISFAC